MGIKAVVFDYGNVLSLPQEESSLGLLASIAEVSEEKMKKIVWEKRAEYDRGAVSGVDYYKKMLAEEGGTQDEGALNALVRADLESWANLNPESVALADAIKASGIKIGILSNMPHEFLALAKKRFSVFKTADAGIFSCELGINKPEKGIYEALLKALALEAGAVAFFDDIPANVDAAKALGIQAFLWKDPASARAELNTLGLAL